MVKPRIAVFSPAPPVPSGISDYIAELLPRLAGDLNIDLYLDGYDSDSPLLKESVRCRPASGFAVEQAKQPYDLCVYHLGNAPCHQYIYPFLYSLPGLTVLHDLSLHDTSLKLAVEAWRGEEYRAEMGAAYGDRGETAAELALAGMHGGFLLRSFTLSELPVRVSAMTVVHEEWTAERIREAVPGAQVNSVPMGMDAERVPPESASGARAAHGIPEKAFLVGTFGLLTPDKGIAELLDAFARLLKRRPDARLVLAGALGEDLPLERMIAERRLDAAATATGRLPMERFLALMAACDVAVFLRWPTRRETSAAALRAMGLGLPTVLSDLAHLRDLPDDVALKVPVVDTERTLRQALYELAENEPLRKRLGAAAKRHVAEHHSWERVTKRWLEITAEAIELARAAEIDHSFLPPHLQR
jgi:glycosyltransferase involved in cell wall biosynthesis